MANCLILKDTVSEIRSSNVFRRSQLLDFQVSGESSMVESAFCKKLLGAVPGLNLGQPVDNTGI